VVKPIHGNFSLEQLIDKRKINLFTNQLKYLLDKLHFILVITVRCFKILFRRNKDIEELFLNYETEHLFDNSYLVINYRFRNALYYQFGATKTLEKHIKIFDLKNCDKEMDFVVHGLFDSISYKLIFEPQLTLENSSFKASFSNLNLKLTERTIPKLIHSKVNCHIKTPFIITPRIKINQPNIKISKPTFNQNEFI
jgi:hypothetical protein